MGWLSNLFGTTETTFKVGLALLSAAGLSAARNFTLPDRAGQVTIDSRARIEVQHRETALLFSTDFLSTNAVQGQFIGAAIGAGTNTTAPAAGVVNGAHPGCILLRSSATANSGYKYQTDLAQVRIAGGEVYDLVFLAPAALAATTYRFGFHDSSTSADAVDGCYFEATAGVLVGKTSSNSVRSTTATLTTLAVNAWYHARVAVDSALSLVTFSIYDMAGTLIGSATLNTNLPTASGRECGAGFVATNSGTTATDLVVVDYQAFSVLRDLPRGAV